MRLCSCRFCFVRAAITGAKTTSAGIRQCNAMGSARRRRALLPGLFPSRRGRHSAKRRPASGLPSNGNSALRSRQCASHCGLGLHLWFVSNLQPENPQRVPSAIPQATLFYIPRPIVYPFGTMRIARRFGSMKPGTQAVGPPGGRLWPATQLLGSYSDIR